MTQDEQIKIIAALITGITGWSLVAFGAYLYGGDGLCLIAIGLPLLIKNW